MGLFSIQSMVLLNTGLAVHRADWNFYDIKSPFARLYFVTHGSATIRMLHQTVVLQPDWLYLIPPFTLHSDECHGDFRLYYFHVYFVPASGLGLFDQYLFPVGVPAVIGDLDIAKRIVHLNPHRELQKYDPRFYDNATHFLQNISFSSQSDLGTFTETAGLLLQLLSRFLHLAQPKFESADRRILQALTYISQNIHQSIDVATLAAKSFLSTDHFIRLFKRELGCTPMNYIHDRKIEQAQTMLLFSDLSIKEIAFGLSFRNLSYFTRLFKSSAGLSPSEYRHKGKTGMF